MISYECDHWTEQSIEEKHKNTMSLLIENLGVTEKKNTLMTNQEPINGYDATKNLRYILDLQSKSRILDIYLISNLRHPNLNIILLTSLVI